MKNAVAVVTGTSSGIGAAVARMLIDRGWAVVGVSRRHAPLEHPAYTHAAIDLADVRALQDAFESRIAPALAANARNRIGLVNNAARADLLLPVERLRPGDVLDMFALNAVAPMWLMGRIAPFAPRDGALRIVNVSTGAAVVAFPGLAAYGASKAALRMAGRVFAAELDSAARQGPAPRDTAILSYQPGTVDTPTQTAARSQSDLAFPWAQMFRDFHARGMLVSPEVPAAEIIAFLESGSHPRLTERRLGAS